MSRSYIFLPVAICFFTTFTFYGIVSAARASELDQLGEITELADETGKIVAETQQRRRKGAIVTYARKATQTAARAVDNVLSDARKLPRRSQCCDDFQKVGGYRDAVRDFNNLNLEGVNRFTLPRGVMGKSGEIGDRTVFVRSSGIDGRPVLEIIKRRKYMDMKDNVDWMTEPAVIRIFYSKVQVEKH